jgi:hypothetical protein
MGHGMIVRSSAAQRLSRLLSLLLVRSVHEPNILAHQFTFGFLGTTIDVFCILANQIPGADTTTDLAFTLDGSTQKPFSHNPDSTSDYEYGVNVFNMSGLTQSAHQLVIATNNPSGSLLLFDYARYRLGDLALCVLFIAERTS